MNNNREDNEKRRAMQGDGAVGSGPIRIGASTPFDFTGRNLTAYGGLLPIATMLERLGFQALVEETLKIQRLTRAMPVYQFIVAMVLALYDPHFRRTAADVRAGSCIIQVQRIKPRQFRGLQRHLRQRRDAGTRLRQPSGRYHQPASRALSAVYG